MLKKNIKKEYKINEMGKEGEKNIKKRHEINEIEKDGERRGLEVRTKIKA